jgi:hypothetical protein
MPSRLDDQDQLNDDDQLINDDGDIENPFNPENDDTLSLEDIRPTNGSNIIVLAKNDAYSN